MNLIRLIAIAVVFWLLYRVILALISKGRRVESKQSPPLQSDTMVRCEVCGLHVPTNEALTKGGKYYCCEAHRDAAEGREQE